MNLKEFKKAVELLVKEYDKLRGEFDKSGTPDLSKFQTELEGIRDKQEKLKKEIVNPVKSGALQEVGYHSEQIQMRLKKIEQGINDTDEIGFQLEALKKLFSEYEETRKELQRLGDDLETMEEDIKDERKKPKLAVEDLRSVVQFVLRNAKTNMASSTKV
jgi:DNA repair ATPase RecN